MREYPGQPYPPLQHAPLRWTADVDLGPLAISPPQCVYSGMPGVVACFAVSSGSGVDGPASGFGCTGIGLVAGKPGYMRGIVRGYVGGGKTYYGHSLYVEGNPSCFVIDITVSPAQPMCVARDSTLRPYSTLGP